MMEGLGGVRVPRLRLRYIMLYTCYLLGNSRPRLQRLKELGSTTMSSFVQNLVLLIFSWVRRWRFVGMRTITQL